MIFIFQFYLITTIVIRYQPAYDAGQKQIFKEDARCQMSDVRC
jgi:hypothetical protein